MSVNSIGRFNAPVDVPEQQEPQEIKQQYNRRLLDEPIKDTVNFRGDEYGEKSNSSGFGTFLLILGGLVGLGVGAGFLGRAMKNGKCLENMDKDKWYGKALTWVTDKCYSGCKSVKKFGIETWDKIKNIFKKKGDN